MQLTARPLSRQRCRPITRADVFDQPGARFVVMAFQGVWEWCRFDLSDLSWPEQKLIFLAALEADYPRRRDDKARRAAAQELVRLMTERGQTHRLQGDWAKLC